MKEFEYMSLQEAVTSQLQWVKKFSAQELFNRGFLYTTQFTRPNMWKNFPQPMNEFELKIAQQAQIAFDEDLQKHWEKVQKLPDDASLEEIRTLLNFSVYMSCYICDQKVDKLLIVPTCCQETEICKSCLIKALEKFDDY